MNYFALFLNNESYIEKCLILIKYISSPNSKSLPHITLRLFKGQDDKLDYIKSKKISYLNIIEPGTFNMETPDGPYVVYLRCESEELEEIDYRPDFPFSRLHITLYEGTDLEYARSLFSLLNQMPWHFKLTFDLPKHLSDRAMGSGTLRRLNYNSVCKDILGENCLDVPSEIANNEQKLQVVKIILDELTRYLNSHNSKSERIKSLYSDKESTRDSRNFVDVSKKSSFLNVEDQMIIDGFPENAVKKPVQDAIYVTPPEYARDMAQCALAAFGDDSKKIFFGDSAIGTGALFIAIKRLVDTVNNDENKHYSFGSAVGIDIDEKMAKEAFLRCSKRDLVVIYGDAISPSIDLGEKRNMMIVNPPYNRHEEIPEEYREKAKELAEAQTGIQVAANAGLYVYHLLIMDKWLDDNGIAVWLLPSIFLQSRYGKAIRQYLTNNVQLLRLHVYDEEKLQFDDTMISTTIVVFKKAPPVESQKVVVTYGDSISEPQFSKTLDLGYLSKEIKNWRSIILNSNENESQLSLDIRFSSLFDIKRGLATGANSFFVIERNKAKEYGIPDMALKPILPKSRYLQSLVINARDDGYPDVEPQMVLIDCDLDEEIIKTNYPAFYDYLQKAKQKDKDGKAIVDRTLVKSRKPWYKQELRNPPLFLLTYMGRNKKDLPPLYFLLNQSDAVALNTYLLLYPKPWLMDTIANNEVLCKKLLSALNDSAKKIIAQQTRVYSGGLQKLEPNELKNSPIAELPNEIVEAYKLTHSKQ